MAVKAVETVRKIRDQQYETTKNLPIEEQIRYINEKSMQLQKSLQHHSEFDDPEENEKALVWSKKIIDLVRNKLEEK